MMKLKQMRRAYTLRVIEDSSEDTRWRDAKGSRLVDFSDEEIFLLSHIDETWHQDFRVPANSIRDDELRCQRDMRVRGKRLWRYHQTMGDLTDILGYVGSETLLQQIADMPLLDPLELVS